MIIMDSNHYGKSMELVECIKDKVRELVENLSSAEMEEQSYSYNDRPYRESEKPYSTKETYRGRYNY